jgi:hypothetical protein
VIRTEHLVPDWEAFERDYVSSGIPYAIVVRSEPQAAVFVDQGAARLGLRFRRTGEAAWTGPDPLLEVRIAEVVVGGAHFLEMWTDARDLFRNFYELATEVVAEVVLREVDPVSALTSAVARWETLLARPNLLSEEAQAGLVGELWLLERLISAHGTSAVDAWVGPDRHAHDFRIGEVEFEVKTTSGARRVHTINGTAQLQPSTGSVLYLVSLKLTDAGSGGRTISEMVAAIEQLVSNDQVRMASFRTKLQAIRYRDIDAAHYPRRRKLRDRAALILVCDGVPRLTPEGLSAVDARFAPERVERITYDINVEGLGVDDGSAEFLEVIPDSEPGDRANV